MSVLYVESGTMGMPSMSYDGYAVDVVDVLCAFGVVEVTSS